jgi:hypothetical protein
MPNTIMEFIRTCLPPPYRAGQPRQSIRATALKRVALFLSPTRRRTSCSELGKQP